VREEGGTKPNMYMYSFTQFYLSCLIVPGFHCADYTDSLTLLPTDRAYFSPRVFLPFLFRVRNRTPSDARDEIARKPPCAHFILLPFALPDRLGIFSIF